MISNARMYAVTEPVAKAWQALFGRVAELAGVELAYVEHPAPALISALWDRPDCGCVFMCGYPYASAAEPRRLIAAPVPAAARYQGRPIYFSEFIVRADSPAQTLSQTFGGRLACMLPESNSGYNAPRHFLMLQAPSARALYRPAARPTPTPQETIEAVIDGDAEVGVVDSYVLDLLRQHEPKLATRLRTLAQTPAAPIPPLVASAGADAEQCDRIRSALLALHRDNHGAALLATLGLVRFDAVQPGDFAGLVSLARESDRVGFSLTDERADSM